MVMRGSPKVDKLRLSHSSVFFAEICKADVVDVTAILDRYFSRSMRHTKQ